MTRRSMGAKAASARGTNPERRIRVCGRLGTHHAKRATTGPLQRKEVLNLYSDGIYRANNVQVRPSEPRAEVTNRSLATMIVSIIDGLRGPASAFSALNGF